MPRSAADVAATDDLAARCRYVAPPINLEPTGPAGGDPAWDMLAGWFEDHVSSWHDAILVYVSRRWDTPIAQVYANLDSWFASRMKRLDQEVGFPTGN